AVSELWLWVRLLVSAVSLLPAVPAIPVPVLLAVPISVLAISGSVSVPGSVSGSVPVSVPVSVLLTPAAESPFRSVGVEVFILATDCAVDESQLSRGAAKVASKRVDALAIRAGARHRANRNLIIRPVAAGR